MLSPKVSILIPTYNYADYLDETIQSVLDQTFSDFELIIVDNNSTDHTQEVVKRYLSDPRISFYKNEKNLGLVGNWNRCIEYARGEFIKFLCADDKFHPRLLEKFIPIMELYPTVSLVTSYRQTFGFYTKILKPSFEGMQKGEKVIYECLIEGKGNCIGEPTTVMFRKSGLKVGKFDPNYISIVDLNMWLRLLAIGDCYIIPEVLSYFRLHEEQVTHARQAKNVLEEYRFYKSITTKNAYQVDVHKLDLHKTIKRKATRCGKTMFRLVPLLLKKAQRQTFKEAAKIAFREGVVHLAFLELFKGKIDDLTNYKRDLLNKTIF